MAIPVCSIAKFEFLANDDDGNLVPDMLLLDGWDGNDRCEARCGVCKQLIGAHHPNGITGWTINREPDSDTGLNEEKESDGGRPQKRPRARRRPKRVRDADSLLLWATEGDRFQRTEEPVVSTYCSL